MAPPRHNAERMDTSGSVRSRLRFDRLDRTMTPDGSGRVSVRLEWGGEIFERTVPCLETQQSLLNAVSQATLRATLASRPANGDANRLTLEVAGVKAIRAFDGWVV